MACSTLVFCVDCHLLHNILTRVSILKKTNHCIHVDVFCPLITEQTISGLDCIHEQHSGRLIRSRNCLVFARAHEFNHICGGIRVAHFFRFVCCPMMCIYVPCCDVSYEFRIKIMIGSSLPPILCRATCLDYVIYAQMPIVVPDTYCVVFLCCISSS